MFKVIGVDGKEYGPVSIEQLRQWAREGRANAQTRVQPEGRTDWIPLGTVPEFEDVLGRRPDHQTPIGAHSPLPADVLTRGYQLDLGSCLSNGADLLRQHFGVVVGAAAVYLLIQGAISGLGAIPFIGPLFSIASLFVLGQLMAGLYLIVLKTIRGQATDLNDLFLGFKTAYIPLLLCYIFIALGTALSAMPGAILTAVPVLIMAHKEAFDPLLAVLAGLGVVVLLVPVIYLATVWWFSLPLVIDKGLGFWQAMETSRKTVNQHWFTVFALVLITGLLNLVGLMLCCVGMFLTFPLGIAVSMYAYESLFAPREERPA